MTRFLDSTIRLRVDAILAVVLLLGLNRDHREWGLLPDEARGALILVYMVLVVRVFVHRPRKATEERNAA